MKITVTSFAIENKKSCGYEKMRTVCRENSCTGCMACIGKCKKNAITIKDSMAAYNAVIDESKCVNCGMCEKVCPNNQGAEKRKPIDWKEGWAPENIRGRASSAGSKYVKSNPIGIYAKVIEKLKHSEKVLFIGLPCQVAAVKNSTAILPLEMRGNLYTVDLICHGSPSPRILDMALEEKGIDIKKLTQIRFRNKTNFGLSSQDDGQVYKTLTPAGVQDMYTYAFLTSLDYTENCYSCQYATIERVADITIGDSWGSDLPQKEQGRGISLLLCQTDKGKTLVKNSGMQLKEVDIDKAIDANHQLRHPSVAPDTRETFFTGLNKGFYKSLSKCAPKVYYKQKIKEILIKTKIIGGGKINRV